MKNLVRIIMNEFGGTNFVHGGIGLQEMVVPVIEYHYLRNDSMEYKRNKQKYDTKLPQREQFQIDIAFAVDEFDFFG